MSTIEIETIEKEVVKKLYLPAEEVFNLKLETGIRYLDSRNGGFVTEALKNSREFWLWWRSIWANRDKALMAHIRFGDERFVHYQVPVQELDNTMALGSCIRYDNSMPFYSAFHKSNLKQFTMYPNDDVVRAALARQDKQAINV